jgi:P-type Cu+ transporter
MAHLRLNIDGMKGPACQQKIERALRGVPGVWAAVICLAQEYGDVEYTDDNGPSVTQLVDAVSRAGYSAKIGG